MPTVFLSPFFNEYNDLNGIPNAGGSVTVYITETTTLASTYTDHTGGVANTNPVILDAEGYPISPIWLPITDSYDMIMKDSAGNTLYQLNHIGLDPVLPVTPTDTSLIWVDTAVSATYSSGTFTIAGTWDVIMSAGRRLKMLQDAVYHYGTVVSATYNSIPDTTTVTFLTDSTAATFTGSGHVYYSILDSLNTAVPTLTMFASNVGTADALVANIYPAIVAESGAVVIVKTSAANTTTTPTLSVNGQTAQNIVKNDLAHSAVGIGEIPAYAEFLYDSTISKWILLNPSTTNETAKWSWFPIGNVQPFLPGPMGATLTGWLANHPGWAKLTNSVVSDIEGRAMAVSSATHAGGTQAGSDDAIVPLHTHTATVDAHNHPGSTGGSHTHGVNDPGHTHGLNPGINANGSLSFSSAAAVGEWIAVTATNSATTGITIAAASSDVNIAYQAPNVTVANTGVSVTDGRIQRTHYADWIYKAS